MTQKKLNTKKGGYVGPAKDINLPSKVIDKKSGGKRDVRIPRGETQ